MKYDENTILPYRQSMNYEIKPNGNTGDYKDKRYYNNNYNWSKCDKILKGSVGKNADEVLNKLRLLLKNDYLGFDCYYYCKFPHYTRAISYIKYYYIDENNSIQISKKISHYTFYKPPNWKSKQLRQKRRRENKIKKQLNIQLFNLSLKYSEDRFNYKFLIEIIQTIQKGKPKVKSLNYYRNEFPNESNWYIKYKQEQNKTDLRIYNKRLKFIKSLLNNDFTIKFLRYKYSRFKL